MPEIEEDAESRLSKSVLKVVVYTPLVTVPAFPEMEPVMVLEKVLLPLNVLSLASRVVEETVMLPPRATDVPLIVSEELARSVLATVAQVAWPEASRDRTNWLVQVVPGYSITSPMPSPNKSAELIESSRRFPFISMLP